MQEIIHSGFSHIMICDLSGLYLVQDRMLLVPIDISDDSSGNLHRRISSCGDFLFIGLEECICHYYRYQI